MQIGEDTFEAKVNSDGGFYYTHGTPTSGGLDKTSCFVVIIIPEDAWPKEGDAMFIAVNEHECNFYMTAEGDILIGRGPTLGPGTTNKGQYFILLDGGHRLPVFKK